MNINLSNINVERILQDPPAKAHMQEQRTIQLTRSIDRLHLQARRRRVKGKRGMNLSLLSDAIECRRKNASLLHRHHQNPTFSATSASAIMNHVRMVCIRMPHKPICPPHPAPCILLTPTPLTAPRLGLPQPHTSPYESESPTHLTAVRPASCTPLAPLTD